MLAEKTFISTIKELKQHSIKVWNQENLTVYSHAL
jgi:hypothetical protein